jgi:hypothetical protein
MTTKKQFWYFGLLIRDESDSLDEIGAAIKGGKAWHEVIWEKSCLWTFPETS